MRPASRGLLWNLAGYGAPHVVMAAALAIAEVVTFKPGGESATPLEAAVLQLFISAALLTCSGLGYVCAVALAAPHHASLRVPAMFGVIAGAVTFSVAAVGALNRAAQIAKLSVFAACGILGFVVGTALVPLIVAATRFFPKARRP